MDEMHEKLTKLKIDLAAMGSVAIAFSSGVDSTFLLKVAHDVLGSHVIRIPEASVEAMVSVFQNWAGPKG